MGENHSFAKDVDGAVDLLRDTLAKKTVLDETRIRALKKRRDAIDEVPRTVYNWFKWTEPIGLYSELIGPIHALLPFYRTLIVPLFPYETLQRFETVYGMSPEVMGELSRRGVVNILYVSSLESYRKSFLLPVLQSGHVGHAFQLASAVALLNDTTVDSLRSEIREPLTCRLHTAGISSPDEGKIRDLTTRAIELSLLGYKDLVFELLSDRRPVMAVLRDLAAYHWLLADPYFRGLGTVVNSDAGLWDVLEANPPAAVGIVQPHPDDVVVPREILLRFMREFKLELPYQPRNPVEYYVHLAANGVVDRNHEILKQLAQRLRESDYQGSVDAYQELGDHLVHKLKGEVAKLERCHKLRSCAISLGLAFTGTKLASIASVGLAPNDTVLRDLVTLGSLAASKIYGGVGSKLSRLMAGSFLGRTSLPFLLWRRSATAG